MYLSSKIFTFSTWKYGQQLSQLIAHSSMKRNSHQGPLKGLLSIHKKRNMLHDKGDSFLITLLPPTHSSLFLVNTSTYSEGSYFHVTVHCALKKLWATTTVAAVSLALVQDRSFIKFSFHQVWTSIGMKYLVTIFICVLVLTIDIHFNKPFKNPGSRYLGIAKFKNTIQNTNMEFQNRHAWSSTTPTSVV